MIRSTGRHRRTSIPQLPVRGLLAAVLVGVVLLLGLPLPAQAVSVVRAQFQGGVMVGTQQGTFVYAKQGPISLYVETSTDTKCVEISGAHLASDVSATGKKDWWFNLTAPAGDGLKSVTVAASPTYNTNNKCTGASATTQASYTLDNTGPTVQPFKSPAANAAGWNKDNVTVIWSTSDPTGGVGVDPLTRPANDTVSANGKHVLTRGATVKDYLGNSGTDVSVNVWLDKAAPSITATQTENANGTTTVTFVCADSGSSVGQDSGIASCKAEGTSPVSSSKTVTGPTTVTGTATDNAGNTSTTSVSVAARDAIPPTVTPSVSPAPNGAGWNKTDATVTFTCTDNTGGSGVASCVADGTSPASASKTVTGETAGTLVGGTATDNAGNTARASTTVKIDRTAPTVGAAADRAANTNGWYNADVTVNFTCTDQGTVQSGIDSCTAPKTLGEGANQSAAGTATDRAGNTASGRAIGISVDKTAPTLTGSFAPGWHNGNVTVSWTCTDSLSGPTAQPSNTVVTGEGADLNATATCTDKAGNSTTKTVSGIQIDRHAPITGISGTSNDWVNGAVTVTLSPSDSLSGVAGTTYTVDGGSPQSGTSFTISSEGDHTITFSSTDNAGNKEATQTVRVKIDKTAPTIRHLFAPSSYTDGAWTSDDVTVSFDCADQGGSGVAGCTAPVTKSTEGAGQQVTGTVTDGAGNSATDTALVSIDKTNPTINASADRAANDNGWYAADVTVSFLCGDALSGIASCPSPKTLSQGANQSASGTATDNAGNTASATLSEINVDKTAPVLSADFTGGWHTENVAVDWSCTDPLSGVDAGPVDDTVTGEGANLSSTASCTDHAGNTSTKTVTGIMIDRTPPATGVSVSGSTKNGWYAAGVQVTLSPSDNLSGVDATYYSVNGGSGQPYTGAVSLSSDGTHTVTFWSTDVAGNVEEKAAGHNSITLKIDKTAPSLSGAATTEPNGNGWYAGDVAVAWTCSDAGSGLDGDCPADSTVDGEGDNLSASASVSDLAGNGSNTTVGGIKIDRTPPTTTASVPVVPDSGWYTASVTVTLTGHDSLSGVEKTLYSVDGGTVQEYTGPFHVSSDGTHEVTFWSKDRAGNVETAGAPVTFNIDGAAPTTTVINPISPASGWFVTSGIPFAFDAHDAHSGIAATYYTIDGGEAQTYGEPFTKDLSTGKHTVTYWSEDIAGNKEAVRSFELKVDTLAPTITGSQTPAPNANKAENGIGWNNTPVDVKFACTDEDSGINGVAGCSGDTRLVNDGAGQMVRGDAVDVAGNRKSVEYGPVNIDQTKPTLSGAPATDANGAGWYNADVTIKWTGTDALSGIDPVTQPADSTITAEGSNLGAGPETIADMAGNVSDPASVTGIKIDRTAPTVSGDPTTQPNAAGWYKDSVTVDFTCTDSLSGVASCPTSKVLSGNGANQSVTSDPATDIAGNASAGKTVSGINIDGTAPSTSSDNQCTKTNGWCTGSSANVVLTAVDQAGLSGVKEIRYSVNGGAEQVEAGASRTVSVPLDGEGEATVNYYAVDNAGNVETINAVSLKYDNIAPAVTHTLTPKPNVLDWNNSDVTVHFDAKDNDAGSGVDPTTVTKDVVVSEETSGLLVQGSAADVAGNVGRDSVTVKLDKTAPSIGGAIVAGTKGDNGWYVGPVTVRFTCSDALSGVAICPNDVVLTENGANSASGVATDKAGNTASITVRGINIDQEKPTVTGTSVAGQTYTLGDVPAATCTAADSHSGLASCLVTVSGGKANGVGTFSYTATATDRAGNQTIVTGNYKVIYRWDGFLQPINDTAHQVGTSTSVFKAGSTVPVKFRLKKKDGTVVPANAAGLWLTPVKGSATSAAVDESLYAVSADSGASYRWDATEQQYIYNWKSDSKSGNYWRIGVTLDDGQTYFVNIGLR